MGSLSHDEMPTGIIFGFLNQIFQLATKFDYPQFVFCWDSKRSYRREVYPQYKIKNKGLTEEMLDLISISKPQFILIRTQILPRLGFVNNFIQTGLEADDIIAVIIKHHSNQFVIVSADNDLYQLLNPNVSMYDPRTKSQYTEKDFVKEWGIFPKDWAKIKALVGCNGDNVKGIPGIGEKTGIKWLKGILKGKKADLISQNFEKMNKINSPLVSLPHPYTKSVVLHKDEFSFKCFEDMCMEHGFKSFLKKGTYEKWQKILS
jgi:DNA polymerase-1